MVVGRDVHQYFTFCEELPSYSIVLGGGKVMQTSSHPIPVQRPFQIIGVDIMDLPMTIDGNSHVLVFQDYLTKWPIVFPVPNQKST